MRIHELVGDTAADVRLEAPDSAYQETAPDDYQASALAGVEYRSPAYAVKYANEALVRLPVAEQPSVSAEADGGQLQFTPIIPRQREIDPTPDLPGGESQPAAEAGPPPKEERVEIDGGVNDVVLKEVEIGDAERIVDLVSFDTEHFTSVGEVTPDVCGSVEDAQTWLANLKSSVPDGWKRIELGIWHEAEMVGCTGFTAKDEHAYLWNWVGKEHTGHGYGGDSLRTLILYLLQNGYSVIEAQVREDNGASRRNMEKTGFKPVNKRHAYIRYRFMGLDDPELS